MWLISTATAGFFTYQNRKPILQKFPVLHQLNLFLSESPRFKRAAKSSKYLLSTREQTLMCHTRQKSVHGGEILACRHCAASDVAWGLLILTALPQGVQGLLWSRKSLWLLLTRCTPARLKLRFPWRYKAGGTGQDGVREILLKFFLQRYIRQACDCIPQCLVSCYTD